MQAPAGAPPLQNDRSACQVPRLLCRSNAAPALSQPPDAGPSRCVNAIKVQACAKRHNFTSKEAANALKLTVAV